MCTLFAHYGIVQLLFPVVARMTSASEIHYSHEALYQMLYTLYIHYFYYNNIKRLANTYIYICFNRLSN